MERTKIDGERIIDIPAVSRPAVAAAGRGDGVEVPRAAAADRAGQGRGLRPQAPDRQAQRHHAGYRLSSLAVDVLGAAGLPYEPNDESAETTTRRRPGTIDYMYDIGLIIGGGSSNIQKNIIGERGLGLPREPKAAASESGEFSERS